MGIIYAKTLTKRNRKSEKEKSIGRIQAGLDASGQQNHHWTQAGADEGPDTAPMSGAQTSQKRLIIDMRRNGGGNNFLGEALRRELERSRFNKPGALYILTGPATFSAAQNFCNRMERETFAVFVGEPTGGAPNHYGDATRFKGEASGLVGGVSTLPWFDSYPMDKRPFILPDRPAPLTFADWAAGRDIALDATLMDTTVDSPSEYSLGRVFYFGRASQKESWAPFWV